MKQYSQIEVLEARIAPATIINPYTVTYQDLDFNSSGAQITGDTVVVHISKPLFTSATAAGKILNFTDVNGNQVASNSGFSGNSTGEFLSEINLVGRTDAQDMNISVKVIPQTGVGNGTVNVGSLLAANFATQFQVSGNIDLGSVYIQGNLALLQAGDNFSTPAVKSLTVGSMNPFTQGSFNSVPQSYVLGPIASMDVKGDFSANLNVIGYQFGTIDRLNIGGSLTVDQPVSATQGSAAHAGGDAGSGEINFTGHVGSATIGSIVGGSGNTSGALIGSTVDPSYINSVHVLGDIQGGDGNSSGLIFAGTKVGKVVVDGSVTGGSGQTSGGILGPLGSVSIGGDLTGGTGISSGVVQGENAHFAAVGIGSVKIGGNVNGGGGAGFPGSPGQTGVIDATTAQSITIGGSLIGGNTAGTDTAGAIIVNSVGSLTIKGDITGGAASKSGVIMGQSGFSAMKYGHILVDGNVQGGSGATSGAIEVSGVGVLAGKVVKGSIGDLHINGGVIGGSGSDSGEVQTAGALGSLYIAQNVTGGTGSNSGALLLGGELTSGLIKGNLTGGTLTGSSASSVLEGSGYIQAGTIGALEIKGSVTAGANTQLSTSGSRQTPSGQVFNSGAIRATGNIVSLVIDGDVIGSVNTYNTMTTPNSPTGTIINPVIISAEQGAGLTASSTTDVAIRSVTFGQNVNYLDVLAGYGPATTTTSALGAAADSTAQIMNVLVKGNLSATNVVAGAAPGTSGMFGTSGDTALANKPVNANLASMIASIIVNGTATGDTTAGDTFGFVAEQVVSVYAANAQSLILHPGPDNDFLAPVTDKGGTTNLYVNEVN